MFVVFCKVSIVMSYLWISSSNLYKQKIVFMVAGKSNHVTWAFVRKFFTALNPYMLDEQ